MNWQRLISNLLLWTPSHSRAKAGRPARTYIQQLCADTACSLEDLPETMDDREGWRERVRNISADGMTWWWWWWYCCGYKAIVILWAQRFLFHQKNSLVYQITDFLHFFIHKLSLWNSRDLWQCLITKILSSGIDMCSLTRFKASSIVF